MNKCPYCHGYGYVQVYDTTVRRVFCDCAAGDSRVEQVRAALEEEGLDPDDPDYQWTRRSDVIRRKLGHLSN